MTRPRPLALACLTAAFCAWSGTVAAQSASRIVALVVTSDPQSPNVAALRASLQRVDTEILQVSSPSDVELRAVMRRFSQQAATSDAAIAYIDMPVVSVDERAFLLQRGETVDRATDLFTEAIPLRAFARMTARAERGGAVLVSAQDPARPLPGQVRPATTAPDPVAGASEILFAPASGMGGVIDVLDQLSTSPDRVDLAEIISIAAAEDDQITLSAVPTRPILLKAPVAAEPVPTVTELVPDETLSAAELEVLEQSLSPSARRNVQRALRKLGHYSGLIDGIIGVQTREAITAYQTVQAAETTGFLTPRQFQELLALP